MVRSLSSITKRNGPAMQSSTLTDLRSHILDLRLFALCAWIKLATYLWFDGDAFSVCHCRAVPALSGNDKEANFGGRMKMCKTKPIARVKARRPERSRRI